MFVFPISLDSASDSSNSACFADKILLILVEVLFDQIANHIKMSLISSNMFVQFNRSLAISGIMDYQVIFFYYKHRWHSSSWLQQVLEKYSSPQVQLLVKYWLVDPID